MKNLNHLTTDAKTGNIDVGRTCYDFQKAQLQTRLNQELSREYYRIKFCELAKELAAANTGQILIPNEEQALWLDGYMESTEDSEDFYPTYTYYCYNSVDYATCMTRTNSLIALHRANQFCQEQSEERATRAKQAAALGYPSDLFFPRRDNDPGASCQTWIVTPEGVDRRRNCNVGNPSGQEFYEGWQQLLPQEIIATWEKECVSAPHFFRLEVYVDRRSIPQNLESFINFESPETYIVSLVIDSSMNPLDLEQQQAMLTYFSMAQLELLGCIQANIDCAYRSAIDPIFGNFSPDIDGGWLGLFGIRQTYIATEIHPQANYEEDEESEELDDETEE